MPMLGWVGYEFAEKGIDVVQHRPRIERPHGLRLWFRITRQFGKRHLRASERLPKRATFLIQAAHRDSPFLTDHAHQPKRQVRAGGSCLSMMKCLSCASTVRSSQP